MASLHEREIGGVRGINEQSYVHKFSDSLYTTNKGTDQLHDSAFWLSTLFDA